MVGPICESSDFFARQREIDAVDEGELHAAMSMYAEAFDQVNALDKLEGFASFYGADFYGLPRNTGTVTLRRESWTPPESFAFGDAQLKPLRSGESLPWRLV